MNLIQDSAAYIDAVKGFVQGRSCAEEFLQRFSHLWRCDGSSGAALASCAQAVPTSRIEPGLYGALDQINALCETYQHCLAPGRGYRVSEEQLRKEIQRIASASPLLDSGIH